jgi:hypothetical protein
MIYTVINHKEVKNDILQAKYWYKNQQKGLEKRFAIEVKNTLNYLVNNPLLFQIKYKTVRIAYTEVFPYSVHYHLDEIEKSIKILGVFHTSLATDKWLKRM